MSSNFKLSAFLFPAILWATCSSFSIFETCHKKYPTPDISKLDAKSIIEDIDGFSENYDQRYQELEMFIKNNMSQSDSVDVKFFLFTQKNKEKPQRLTKNDLKKSNFNHKHSIKVLVHGLQPLKGKDNGTAGLRHALLVRGQHNVIVMRYKKVAKMPYTQALKQSFLVAKNAADFLQHLLKEFKITASRLHLIGFEFGGQLVGNMGNHIPGLARISALDPAGALFERFPAKHRLSPDDAIFVDVIHTSTRKFPRGLGTAMPLGHQDFYPNGGEHQPGCKKNFTAENSGGRDAAEFKNAVCSNERALELYTESVCDQICTFRGRQCESYIKYQSHQCLPFLSATRTMGFYAKKNSGQKEHEKFYLDTNKQYPYCKLLPF